VTKRCDTSKSLNISKSKNDVMYFFSSTVMNIAKCCKSTLKIVDCLKNSIHELIELKTTISKQLHSTLQHGHTYRDEGKLCGHVKVLVEWARDVQGWKGLITTTTNVIQDGGYLPCCHKIDNNDK
jgi:hypothetical protein